MTPETIVADLRAEIVALPKRDTPHLRAVRKAWTVRLKATPPGDVVAAAQALERGAGQGGKWIGYELIRFHSDAFAAVREAEVADFAGRAESWFAVDALGTILAGPLWGRGQVSDALITSWTRAENRWLRRLALVATVGRNGRPNPPDAARTLAICRALAGDRDDMVEKAVSWALRFLTQRGERAAVAGFIAEMGEQLAARVRREVRHKLATGLKSGRRREGATAD